MNVKQFKSRLSEVIKNSGLTHKAIAQEIGISPSNISKYLHSNIRPSTYTFIKLCKCLRVTADYLLGLSDEY